ncbi:hypothetical protein GLOIN_2v1786489 [Rhizophagus irregularis DAOM 181602=DAOM 197198]|uniref:Uncharacterized protein n=1 Tax=Rhizophagus irregularis (strain DAOM 181602 / DAOM 197198 / MUCL 43194) TaxID=747089 RepID=U9SP74_RHIID|nr:hypothetical protein GLOIN_2v1786489 [Rhizophagus irregularis DAOM 181602=DAOM 197198]POG61510.1 hypothetical protein GLOIN_2v1786489 [Rhizophagus irregularis DAOM 181602=DAOM 197198]|eukprot:XP_025168376.1 hypothetical protein GLOIN_2v1786489 [Rhizophagus irregularis DAOM 181602=DAOM 197198]
MRQDQDKWQLIRDLTKDEMEEFKKGEDNGYDFLKKLQQEYTAAFIKIIKITQNCKVIGYFSNHNMMEKAVELSLKKNNLALVWMVRNFKMVFKSGKSEKVIPSRKSTPLPQNYIPERNKNKNKKTILEEEEVVDMIKGWQIREKKEEESESDDENFGINLMEKTANKPLKRDNVATDEIVDIIRDYQTDRIIYNSKKEANKSEKELRERLTILEEIFEVTSNMMEWEHIYTPSSSNGREKRERFLRRRYEKETGEKWPNPASPLAVEITRKKEDGEKDRKKKQRED